MKINIIRRGQGFISWQGWKIDKGIWDTRKFIDIYFIFKNGAMLGISIDY